MFKFYNAVIPRLWYQIISISKIENCKHKFENKDIIDKIFMIIVKYVHKGIDVINESQNQVFK